MKVITDIAIKNGKLYKQVTNIEAEIVDNYDGEKDVNLYRTYWALIEVRNEKDDSSGAKAAIQ